MKRRFLNDSDYLSVISPDSLAQMVRGNSDRFVQAEESAEMSIVERLCENYEVEQELIKGKYIAEYDRRITFPVGVHLYFDGVIHEVIRSISGYKAPADVMFWAESNELLEVDSLTPYSQFGTSQVGDIVQHNGGAYVCIVANGYKFGRIASSIGVCSARRLSTQIGSRQNTRCGALFRIRMDSIH